MRKKIVMLLAAVVLILQTIPVNAAVNGDSKPAMGVHHTNGNKEKGSSSSNTGSKGSSNETKKDTSNKKSDSKGNSESNSGITTQDRINVSEETSRGETQTSTSESTKTVVDSYNWYFTNNGELVPGVADDWLSKEMLETTPNVSVTYYHSGHYIGIRYPNKHTETTVTTTEYQLVQYEYTDPNGKVVPGSRLEYINSSSNTTCTVSKEDRSVKHVEEWDVPITGCDIGEDCEPIVVTTPVPPMDPAEYDFDLEMTN